MIRRRSHGGQMRTESGLRTAGALPPTPEDTAERRRMSFYGLFFLAAGGVIGSGWLVGGAKADYYAGSWAVFSWLIGGALMLVIAAVMVKLSTAVPKTGGLIFLPLQSSGPLLATVVAAGVWVFYAANPASEAVAMVQGLASWSSHLHSLVNGDELRGWGIAWAAFFILLMTAVNLLGPRRFLLINNVLTTFKVFVPLLIIALLLYAKVHLHAVSFRHSAVCVPPPTNATLPRYNLNSVLSAVTAASVIYAYLGFQGPLDIAGNVRRRGIGEAARLRRAIYATVCGSILLYVSLQLVIIYIRHRCGGMISGTESPYTEFAKVVAPHWAAPLAIELINLDTVLSPAGTGMIFTYVLTREVAALSRAHLTHRGLQKSRYSVIPLAGSWLRKLFGDDRLDVYWLILIVDFFVSGILFGILLLCFDRNLSMFNHTMSIMVLIIYAIPGVVLASLRHQNPGLFPGRRYSILAEVGFVSIAVIFFLAGWNVLWPGMTVLTVSCLLLFGLPLLAPASRWYDAKAHATQFRQLRTIRQLRTNPAAASAALLFGFFAMLTLASRPFRNNKLTHLPGGLWSPMPVVLVAVLAVIVFRLLVKLSRQYMKEHPPTLPTLAPAPKSAGSAPLPPQAATGQSG